MTEQAIKIDNVENKVSKKGDPYVRVNDKYTAFDKELTRKLEDSVGKTFMMTIKQNGDFFNIRGIGEETDQKPVVGIVNKKQQLNELGYTPTPVAPEVMPKQNSREFGKAGDRLKLYFDDAKDLKDQIEEMKALELFPKED